MRLIDADALVDEIVKIDDLRKLSTKTIGKALDAVPTINAIPVEWVKKKITGATKDLGTVIHDGVLMELLLDWQKEQEAR